MTHVRLTDLPAGVQARLRAEGKAPKPKRRTMNRMEREFGAYLRAMYPQAEIRYEDVTLRLGHDVRYTGDFLVVFPCVLSDRCAVHMYEVKGFKREDAIIKLRVAARLYQWITFYLVTRKRGEGWTIEEVPK